MKTIENALLYYKQSCPFCLRVISFMEQNGIELELRSTTDPSNKTELIAIGGKPQVPCLVVQGTPLYESSDIIDYLTQKLCLPE